MQSSTKTLMLIKSSEEASGLFTLFSSLKLNFNLSLSGHTDQFFTMAVTDHIECFILDWNFGAEVVTELVGRIRKIDNYKKTPIICITNSKQDHLPKQYSSLNLNLAITRPFDKSEIIKTFNEVLNAKELSIIPEKSSVLIMDDNPDILEIMIQHMEGIKHTNYKTCQSIAEAKAMVEKFEFDLFLLDWNLPDGTCLDLIKFIRTTKGSPRLTNALVVVVTGRNDIDDTFTLLQHGVVDQLIKPFDQSEFEDKISYALERHSKKICLHNVLTIFV